MRSLTYIKDGKTGQRPENLEIVFDGVYPSLDPFNARGTIKSNLSGKVPNLDRIGTNTIIDESSAIADSSRVLPSAPNQRDISPLANMKFDNTKWRGSRN